MTKTVKFFSNNKSSYSQNNNGNAVAADKTNDSKKYKNNKIDKNNSNNNNNSNSSNNRNKNNNKGSTDNKVNKTRCHQPQKKLFSYSEPAWQNN